LAGLVVTVWPHSEAAKKTAEQNTFPSVFTFIVSIPNWVFKVSPKARRSNSLQTAIPENSDGPLAINDDQVNIGLQR
jgi:hypothetical protein